MQSSFSKIPLFLSIIFFLFFCAIFLYFFGAISNHNKESQLKELEWRAETSRREEIKALDLSIKRLEGERVQLETHFAKSSDVVPFLDTIEELAPQVGAEAGVSSVDISEDRLSLLVGLKASGTFESLYKFLTLLENSPYELEFLSMDIRKGDISNVPDQGQTSSKWGATFKIKLLSFIE
ncbi:hypothetical protein A3A05_02450 [Candidatus Nomurabacteria bacterium RIFCSPLOWO2_01_FULL_41_12]|uniref:Pilus assembly protein PilO n=1 Tax=Candidatus Nomurabacteria bacterium RIFCSPLOWO2_01_FULL_41_12 TaxID=1801774 RepID=A0A1F6WUL5_9BACT|nr:MAG: hypothetical protein A2732_00290 [Candidatus Nomurabacteria bacterium RIFCSPHIGHO2_01_FULL_40_10]OGI85566.1 MAG: hypothetical protein A3A05_02450 [Candidatus Nomurabacteria bacterium RIFCSPLOWO2_01_FULL_41_12]